MYVIGTAGHVDHGKSALIEAITGTHPDRLAEERERELSIVLGFDSLTLKSGEEVGIIDVPGHRDFIENMLSGIGGIDAVLFVVAADEGVMPQTEEHLAIVDLLGIEDGVVALTKIDLVKDEDWLDLVEADLRESLEKTTLADAPLVRVSAKTGQGVETLIEQLEHRLSARTPRPDLGRPRLSVDRVFTISGFGTVVTGTLLDGILHEGEDIVVLPRNVKGRIRGMQVHDRKVDTAGPGTRTAINVAGIDVDEVERGDVIAHPGDYRPTRRLDVFFQLLPDAQKAITHDTRAKLFLGADEVMARIRLLGEDRLDPGREGWLQLELPEPVVALRGDRYILRRPSPSQTMGGGIILDPHPRYRHRRFDQDVLDRLRTFAAGNAEDIIRQVLQRSAALPRKALIVQSNLDPESAGEAIHTLAQSGEVVLIGGRTKPDQLIADKRQWEGMLATLEETLSTYHRSFPLRPGMPLEELRSQSGLNDEVFQAAIKTLDEGGRVVLNGPVAASTDHEITFSPETKEQISQLMKKFHQNPHSPPTVDECIDHLGEETYQALVSLGELKQVSEDVVFKEETYQEMREEIKTWLKEKETITVAEARDHFDSSRRYILALMEHLDIEGVTIREGDVRRLR